MKYPNFTAGHGEAIINIIGGWDRFMAVLSGRARLIVEMIRYVVNLAEDPYCPEGWEVIYHNPGPSNFECTPDSFRLHLSPNQQDCKWIEGWDLLWVLVARGPRVNANMIDFWLANPDTFPKDWEVAYAWDTLYLDPSGYVCVRCVYRHGGELNSSWSWLGRDFGAYDPAVVPARS
jgi:hypothetical protein